MIDLDKLKEIEVGDEFSNLKELLDKVGLKKYSGGKDKKTVVSILNQYLSYEHLPSKWGSKTSHRIIITEVKIKD